MATSQPHQATQSEDIAPQNEVLHATQAFISHNTSLDMINDNDFQPDDLLPLPTPLQNMPHLGLPRGNVELNAEDGDMLAHSGSTTTLRMLQQAGGSILSGAVLNNCTIHIHLHK